MEEAGQGDVILLLHGFGGSTFSWRDSFPKLAETHRVIALDLFGFGYTERPRRLRHYSRRGQLDLILGVLDHLGVPKAHVIGHSYGGGLAMTLAAQHPDRVRSLVLVDSTAPNWAISRRRNLAEISPLTWLFVRGFALRPATVRNALERSWYDDSEVTEDIVEGYLERLRIQGAARAYRGLTVPMEHESEDDLVLVQDLTQPTLVIWGAEDELIPVEDGRLAAEQMRDSRFVVIERSGHSPMEEKPQAFLTLVTQFLQEVDSQTSGPALGRRPLAHPGLNHGIRPGAGGPPRIGPGAAPRARSAPEASGKLRRLDFDTICLRPSGPSRLSRHRG